MKQEVVAHTKLRTAGLHILFTYIYKEQKYVHVIDWLCKTS